MWLRLRLKLRLLGFRISAALVAPLRWNERRLNIKRAHQLALARVQGDALVEVSKVLGAHLVTLVSTVVEPQKDTSKVLQTWLEGFKVTSPPSTTSVSDKDEYDSEMRAQMEAFGIDASNPLAVMKWLDREGALTSTLD